MYASILLSPQLTSYHINNKNTHHWISSDQLPLFPDSNYSVYSIAADFRLPIRSLLKGPSDTIKGISSSTSKAYPSWVEIRNRLPQILQTLGRVYCQAVKSAFWRLKFHYINNTKINFVPHREQRAFIELATWWMLYGEIIIDYRKNYTKNIQTVYTKCWNFSVKRCWTCNNHWTTTC